MRTRHPPASAQPTGSAGSVTYPSRRLLHEVVETLSQCPGNEFTACDVLTARRGRDSHCCIVNELPPSEGRPSATEAVYFGRDSDGYIVVVARSPTRGWPLTATEQPCPVRLGRWIVAAATGEVARHTCDTPGCIARAHLIRGTQGQNLDDALKRKRRVRVVRTARSNPMGRHANDAPSLTPAPRPQRTAAVDADELFCVTGFYSPSKKARKQSREPVARERCAARRPLVEGGVAGST